jgi:Pentapeptide repeats (8 copies)
MVFLLVGIVLGVAGLVVAGTLSVLPLEWWGANKDAVQAIALPVGAVGAMIALVFAGWRSWAQFKQMQTDRLRQVTDSFAKAVELLAHGDTSVRLGAIYALERIARQNRDEHWPIMETLTAYVRGRAPWTPKPPPTELEEMMADGLRSDSKTPWQPATDVQAALTVIARRTLKHDPAAGRLDLRETDLRGADLRNARLDKAMLNHAHLEDANLIGAHLRDASLPFANLDAYIDDTHLEGASLVGAHLPHIKGAHLSGADLSLVDLRRSDISQPQLDSAKGSKTTEISESLKRPKHWAD